MKKVYVGLDAVQIPFETSNQVITYSTTTCHKIYVTHFDFDENNLCDQAESPKPGWSTWTEAWSDDPPDDET